MKQSEIKVGEVYRARVSGKTVLVKVTEIFRRPATVYRRAGICYVVTNMATGREITVKSAMRLRPRSILDDTVNGVVNGLSKMKKYLG